MPKEMILREQAAQEYSKQINELTTEEEAQRTRSQQLQWLDAKHAFMETFGIEIEKSHVAYDTSGWMEKQNEPDPMPLIQYQDFLFRVHHVGSAKLEAQLPCTYTKEMIVPMPGMSARQKKGTFKCQNLVWVPIKNFAALGRETSPQAHHLCARCRTEQFNENRVGLKLDVNDIFRTITEGKEFIHAPDRASAIANLAVAAGLVGVQERLDVVIDYLYKEEIEVTGQDQETDLSDDIVPE